MCVLLPRVVRAEQRRAVEHEAVGLGRGVEPVLRHHAAETVGEEHRAVGLHAGGRHLLENGLELRAKLECIH